MTKLLPYQVDGVKKINEFNGRCLLADVMGLGKSLQLLSYIVQYKKYPALVVCPANLKVHWKNQTQEHFGLDMTILSGMIPRKTKALKGHSLYCINYEILEYWLPFLKRMQFRLIGGDEVQAIGNLKAKRTRLFMRLCKEVPHVVLLSGTPLVNRPWELFPSLHLLRPEEYSSPFSYGMEFCEGENSFGTWKFKGAKNLDKLHKKLVKSVMIRRTKEQVLKDLPPLRRFVEPIEISDRKQYDYAEKDIISWLIETKGLEVAERAAHSERYTKFTYLKHLAAQLKLDNLMLWIDSFLKETDEKLLVGTIHRDILAKLVTKYETCCTFIQGGMTQKQRSKAESDFRFGKDCRILFGNEKAAGVGLNLPEASTVLVAEFPWNPGTCDQFVARAHRLTTKHTVDAYYLVADRTIEELLVKIIQRKSKVLDKVLDGGQAEDNLDLFDELQAQLEKKQ